jgi:hypothetical protein
MEHYITAHETEIAYTFLSQPHIPTIAIDLFRAQEPSAKNLGYLASLWHRYTVASRLSDEMCEWIMHGLFLRRNPAERTSFAEGESLIRRRLVPFLLIVGHFFETYRRLLLDPSSSELDHAARERQIIDQYDNRPFFCCTSFSLCSWITKPAASDPLRILAMSSAPSAAT